MTKNWLFFLLTIIFFCAIISIPRWKGRALEPYRRWRRKTVPVCDPASDGCSTSRKQTAISCPRRNNAGSSSILILKAWTPCRRSTASASLSDSSKCCRCTHSWQSWSAGTAPDSTWSETKKKTKINQLYI